MKTTNLSKFVLIIFASFALQFITKSSFAQTEPTIEGSPFEEIKYKNVKRVSDAEKKKIEKNAKKGPSPVAGVAGPQRRTRGREIEEGGRKIYQFVNQDFPYEGNTCGQAAVATAMWKVGLNNAWNNDAKHFAKELYQYAPPKITIPGFGSNDIGTDWHQVNYALDGYKKYGIRYSWFKGRDKLNKYIDEGYPCIIMMDMGVFPPYKWGIGHWVVAFARTSTGYYVTNNGSTFLSWTGLNKGWGGTLTEGNLAKVHGTAEMFCVVWKK